MLTVVLLGSATENLVALSKRVGVMHATESMKMQEKSRKVDGGSLDNRDQNIP